MPRSLNISINSEWGTRPSMMCARGTPPLSAVMQHSTGPIVNPSRPKCQLLGVANLDQMRLYNQVYQKIGIDYGIVNSIDGYDEISLTGDFKVTTKNYERISRPEIWDSRLPSPRNS